MVSKDDGEQRYGGKNDYGQGDDEAYQRNITSFHLLVLSNDIHPLKFCFI